MGYLKNLGITQSVSKAHTPYDNSVNLFANMKREELYCYKYSSVTDFKKRVGEYIDFYNAKRSHAAL